MVAHFNGWAGAVAAGVIALGAALAGPVLAQDRAEFAITSDVVTPDLGPFTATIMEGPRTLTYRNTGFEPVIVRQRIMAERDDPDRVYGQPSQLSWYGYFRAGLWDGAEVDVFRPVDGAFKLIRSDRVAEGGHRGNRWVPATGGRILKPDISTFQYKWSHYARRGVDYYFTLRAIDRDGRLSPPAEAVIAQNPEPYRNVRVDYDLIGRPRMDDSADSRRVDAPSDLRVRVTADGIANFSWTPPRGRIQGYVLYLSETPPAAHEDSLVELAGSGPAIAKGDMVVLRQKLYRSNRKDLLSNFTWDLNQAKRIVAPGYFVSMSDDRPGGLWELRKHDPDTPVTEPGETYLSVTFDDRTPFFIGNYHYSGTSQTFYPVMRPGEVYTAEFWMRGQASQPMQFVVQGVYGNLGPNAPIKSHAIRLTPEWTKVQFEFSVPALTDTRQAGSIQLRFDGAGQADIDNFRIYRSDSGYMQWSPEDLSRLRASGMSALRTHALIKLGLGGYDLDQLTNTAGLIAATVSGATLTQNLQLIEAAGMDPWLQFEPHLSRDEWLGLLEYLAAPYDPAVDTPQDKPWAAKRHAQGFATPWTDRFDRVFFEIGNETWNRLFAPWIFPAMTDAGTGAHLPSGTVYGMYQEYVLAILRESPYWPRVADKFEAVLGGWNSQSYGALAAEASPNSDLMTVAFYNGGWDAGEGALSEDPFSYSSLLTHTVQWGAAAAERHRDEVRRISAERGRPLALGTYEAGPGYAMNGLNGARVSAEEAHAQDLVMKSNAAGTSTLDTFLMNARMGMTLQNYFLYGAGSLWRSHAEEYLGGHTFPSWNVLALFNNVGTGDMLEVQRISAPVADLDEIARRPAVKDAPMVEVYATRKGDRVTVFALSRRVEDYPVPGQSGRTHVTIDLPFRTAQRATRYSMTGGYRATNYLEFEAGLVSRPVAVPAPGTPLVIDALPPGETMVYVFDGVETP